MVEMTRPFRVLIAGGSIAGLSLALVLEKAGIDYILLEKREIAPQLGASVGFMPHGVRILEQMGIWDDIRAIVNPLNDMKHYKGDGTLIYNSLVLPEIRKITKRPHLLMSRQKWLEVLHSHIKDKSKLRAQTGIVSYKQSGDGVTVTTDNGETFEGSILIGADGIHSQVRFGMAEDIAKEDPEAAKELTEGFSAQYRCIFGVSKNEFKQVPGKAIMLESQTSEYSGVDHCGLVAAGMPGQLFWFFYLKSETTTRTPNVPRYSEADAEEAMRRYGNIHVGADYTFGDLWDARVATNMLALEEGVLQTKWSQGRVVLLGDSCHKCTINTGLGAQMALEGICNLTNGLVALLETSPDPTTGEVTRLFDDYEAKQRPRAEHATRISGRQTRLEAQANWVYRFLAGWVMPFVPDWVMAKAAIKGILVGSPCMSFLPKPEDVIPEH